MKAQGKALFPFLPSGPDFDKAMAFFADLGFAPVWKADGLAGLRFGDAGFTLQDIDVPEWQSNQMITLEVDDLDVYWRDIDALRLPVKYPGVRIKPPTDFPWGREVHIVDPAGLCWHVRQSAPSPATTNE
jgi:predicted enzyme related to lactoylglutathione lyase